MNKELKNKIKILIFLIILCILATSFLVINYVNEQKEIERQALIEIEKQKNNVSEEVIDSNQVDVLAIGNSDLYSAFNPMQLWNEYGITSYVCSAAKQNMKLSYMMLNEVLKYQKPKVLILELDNFFETRGSINDEELLNEVYTNCGPLFKHTKEWEKIKNKKFHHRTELNGYYFDKNVESHNDGYSYMGRKRGEEEMVEYTEKYFPMIMQLAQEKNINVILVNVPSSTSWTYKKHNTVETYAKKYHVPYLDMNIDEYDIDFDWKKDSRDGGNHLNYSGATKITRFFGQYLMENYSFVNHQDYPQFSEWNRQYKEYLSKYMHE